MAKVSVIVPVYKVEPYLHRCVDSILNQSYQDFELILVDDGSPDRCGAICDEYAQKDRRIHVIHRENGGLSAARNTGIDWSFANSDSQWFAFIDSDDWVHREYLKFLLEAAEQNGAGMAACGLRWTDRYLDDHIYDHPQSIVLNAEDALVLHHEKCVCACSKVIRKELFQNLRFPIGKLYEDAFVTHELIFGAEKVVLFEERLYYYYNNPTSITRAKWSNRQLDSIEAYEIRLNYLLEHGYQKAYNREQEIYVEELTDKLLHISDSPGWKEQHQATFDMLREKLRAALKKARKDGLVRWNGESMWAYFLAMHTDAVWKTLRVAQKVYHRIRR